MKCVDYTLNNNIIRTNNSAICNVPNVYDLLCVPNRVHHHYCNYYLDNVVRLHGGIRLVRNNLENAYNDYSKTFFFAGIFFTTFVGLPFQKLKFGSKNA